MQTGNHYFTVAAIAVAFLFLAMSGLARATATATLGTRMRRLAFIVAFLLWAMPSSSWAACSGASMELCQNVTGTRTTSNPTQAITVTNTGDALIVMGAAYQTGSVTPGAITAVSGCGATWEEAPTGFPVTLAPPTAHQSATIWYGLDATAGACTVSMTWTGFTQAYWNLLEAYPGTGGTFQIDVSNSTSIPTATKTWQSGLITTTHSSDFLAGFTQGNCAGTAGTLSDYGTGGGTPSALSALGGAPNYPGAYQITSGTGQFGFEWSGSTSCSDDGGIIALADTGKIVISPTGERLQIARSSAAAMSDEVNTAFTFTDDGFGTCNSGNNALNGIDVSLFQGTCADLPGLGLELELVPFAPNTVNHQTYGTFFGNDSFGTVSARILTLPTPVDTCGEWLLNLEVSGLDTATFGLTGGSGPGTTYALEVEDLDGNVGCLDVTNAVVGDQIDPPTKTVRRGVRQ